MTEPEVEHQSQSKAPKWQTEVEQILEKSDRDSTSYEKARAAAVSTRYKAPEQARHYRSSIRGRVGDGVWFGLAIGFAVLALIVGHYWPLPGRILAILSVVIFVLLITRAIIRSRRGDGPSRTWRGRDTSSDYPGPPSWRNSDRDGDDDPPKVGSR